MTKKFCPCVTSDYYIRNGMASKRYQYLICFQNICDICGIDSLKYEADHIWHVWTCYKFIGSEDNYEKLSDISFLSSDDDKCPDNSDTVPKSCSSEIIVPYLGRRNVYLKVRKKWRRRSRYW